MGETVRLCLRSKDEVCSFLLYTYNDGCHLEPVIVNLLAYLYLQIHVCPRGAWRDKNTDLNK